MDPDESVDRRLASRELGRAKRAIQGVRTFLIVLFLVDAVGALAYLLTVGDVHPDDRAAYRNEGLVFAGFAIAFLLGAILIRRQPRVWTAIAAVVQSLSAIVSIFTSGPVGIAVAVLLALACWAAYRAVDRAVPLLEEYADLRAARELTGRRRRSSR